MKRPVITLWIAFWTGNLFADLFPGRNNLLVDTVMLAIFVAFLAACWLVDRGGL